MLSEIGTPEQWQQRATAVINEAIPTAQKTVEEAVSTMNRNAKTSLEALQKAIATGQNESITDVQERTRELWESSLTAVRENTQAMFAANRRIVESWIELAEKGNGGAAGKGE